MMVGAITGCARRVDRRVARCKSIWGPPPKSKFTNRSAALSGRILVMLGTAPDVSKLKNPLYSLAERSEHGLDEPNGFILH